MARQLFGDNIVCHSARASLSQSYLDNKCFINGTMTMDEKFQPLVYHDYYQWVAIVLLLSAFTSYFPFSIWSRRCGSYLNELTTKIHDDSSCERLYKLVEKSRGNYMFWKIWALEWYYMVHFVVHGIVFDKFFNRVWTDKGWSWTAIDTLFPESGFCNFDYFNGGDLTTGKFVCLLPLNSVYRKVFWGLYVLAIFLIVLQIITFFYRVLTVIRFGNKWVNVWWVLHVAQSEAQTWESQQWIKQKWKRMMAGRPVNYIPPLMMEDNETKV
ncbi:innexin [Caerostris extrusa]|uniref:Innexin n=1 Tax=Caerostris extrusa TaxID=172846 RepID=A0AAV4V4D1_CAEEX|nr:innexin [Caerostris extrusa]